MNDVNGRKKTISFSESKSPPDVHFLQVDERFENVGKGLHIVAERIGGTGAAAGRTDDG